MFNSSYTTIGTKYDLELVQLDVKTAFLHGDLDEEIFMEQPEGFKVKRRTWSGS